jgi:hypothetical protein
MKPAFNFFKITDQNELFTHDYILIIINDCNIIGFKELPSRFKKNAEQL